MADVEEEGKPLVGGIEQIESPHEGGGVAEVIQRAKLGKLGLIGIIYFSVAGGPEGTENMVQTAGPLASVIGVVIFALLFAVPTSLMTAELSSMYPDNGGFVIWTRAAFGESVGAMSGYLQFASNAVDAALYPDLLVSYVSHLTGRTFDQTTYMGLKAGILLLVTVVNLFDIAHVGQGSFGLMILLLFPFAIFTTIALSGAVAGTTMTGWDFSCSHWLDVVQGADWKAFSMALLWNMGMWDTSSVCSGEVKNIAEDFPFALGATVSIVILNYILPILAFTGLDSRYESYDNGYYITIAKHVGGPVWGWWMGISQCVSVVGLLIGAVVKNTWMLCGMGEQGMAPACFAMRWSRSGTPMMALAATQTLTIAMILYGDFNSVLACDMLLYVTCLILEVITMLWLRLTVPEAARPYKIPLDFGALLAMFMPSIIVCGSAFAAARWQDVAITSALVAIGALVTQIHSGCRRDALEPSS